jgi:hypothetical protein
MIDDSLQEAMTEDFKKGMRLRHIASKYKTPQDEVRTIVNEGLQRGVLHKSRVKGEAKSESFPSDLLKSFDNFDPDEKAHIFILFGLANAFRHELRNPDISEETSDLFEKRIEALDWVLNVLAEVENLEEES